MLFLLNDTVLSVDMGALLPASEARRFEHLGLAFVTKLGQELFSEEPHLVRVAPDRARRLACLIAAAAPDINAALFVAPRQGCRPEEVATRFVSLSMDVMAHLHARAEAGRLDAASADREVWRRLAA